MKSKDDIASHKGRAVHTLDSLLDKYIENENSAYLKKADLISYWLEEFSKYIEQDVLILAFVLELNLAACITLL